MSAPMKALKLAWIAIVAISVLSTIAFASPSQPKSRLVPLKPAEIAFSGRSDGPRRLIVKFAEGSGVRVAHGEFFQQTESDAARDQTIDIFHINNVLKTRPSLLRTGAVKVERLFSRSEAALDADRKKGMARTGEELADLNLYYVISFDSSVDSAEAIELANSLLKLGVVETTYFEPTPHLNAVDISPPTPGFEHLQNHLDRAYDGKSVDPQSGLFYNGIDARFAWTIPGGRGAGMKFIDIEYGWDTNHEDLNMPTIARDPDTRDLWHGTAVLGLINAQPNGYGMTGIASDAKYGLVNVASGNAGPAVDNLALAINRAAGLAAPGDVILIEVGIDFDYRAAGCSYSYYTGVTTVPAEHYQAVFDAIKVATANGIIVVETASNGSANLDDPCFGKRYNRTFRDSGAIMVGASAKGSLQRVLTSSYGSRIDVQAQGNEVATTVSTANFNNLFALNPPDEKQQYTSLFSGTSSAGAIVTGAILSIQGIQKARNGRTFTPAQMRTLLTTHGTNPDAFAEYSQGGINGIGPMPNLRRTIEWMLTDAGNGRSKGDELSAASSTVNTQYVVTVTAGGNGTVSPTSASVPAFGKTWITATPAAGYVPIFFSGSCPVGTVYGNTYQTGQIVGNCSISVAFVTVPASPANVSVKAGNRSATFQFAPSAADPLAPTISYTVTCNGGTYSATAVSPPIHLSGLTNGVAYSCSVTGKNSVGSSAPSIVVHVTPIQAGNVFLPIKKGS